jgi:hypothetical protein
MYSYIADPRNVVGVIALMIVRDSDVTGLCGAKQLFLSLVGRR